MVSTADRRWCSKSSAYPFGGVEREGSLQCILGKRALPYPRKRQQLYQNARFHSDESTLVRNILSQALPGTPVGILKILDPIRVNSCRSEPLLLFTKVPPPSPPPSAQDGTSICNDFLTQDRQ